jgi:hypothetical protein
LGIDVTNVETKRAKRSVVFGTIVAALCLASTAAMADEVDEEFQASITISLNLEIMEQNEIDFGTIGRPSVGSNTITLDWDSGDIEIGGGGDAFYVEGAQNGRYRVRGPRDEDIVVTATIGSFGVPGIEVEETIVEGQSGSFLAQLNPSGMFFAHIGGVLTLTPDAPAGLHTANFYITANYP